MRPGLTNPPEFGWHRGAIVSFHKNDSLSLPGLAGILAQREDRADWTFTTDDFWCHVQPADYPWQSQGWKLHVSATPLAAPCVLERAATVLLRAGCAFKFARSLEQVTTLVSAYCPRGNSGKFLTAYPRDDEQFRLLAEELHRATQGLPGPAVLSDRPYRPGSLVHYRYGAFLGRTVLTNDGGYESVLVGPGGELVHDERTPWFSPPPWAVSPLTGDPHASAAPRRPSAVLLADRFVVREAIQHSNKGGVFRAVDRHTGEDVVIKQARPHVGSGLSGTDARDALRNEAEILDILEPLRLAPRKVALFEQQNSLFLAQEAVPGLSMRHWAGRHDESGGRQEADGRTTAMASRLVEIVAAVHERGLLLRDLSPNNIMVTPDDGLRLIDLEHVSRPGTIVGRVQTPAYASPEQTGAPELGPAPELTSDLYALGATLFFLVSGSDPVLPEDRPVCRPGLRRIATLLGAMGARSALIQSFTPLILGLMDDEPARRWPLDQVRDHLERPAATPHVPVPVPGGEGHRALPPADGNRLAADGISHILATMDLADRNRLWPSGRFGSTTDACNVQHGAAGVLQVLTTAARQLREPRLADAVRDASDWLVRRLPDEPRLLPGLYFGRSGTAWALHDAGLLLGDQTLTDRALELARRIPVDWPNPDVCHGTAGAGLAQLRLWQTTGEAEFGKRVRDCADSLAAAAEHTEGHVFWPVPADFASQMAGSTYYGFGHGVAGIGTFLLAAGLATENDAYLRLARAAGRTLADAAIPVGDEVRWPAELGQSRPSRLPLSWCSGVSGIGAFLIRLWRATGEPRYRELAERAGRAVQAGPEQQAPVICHGLAGSGELLLDLAEHLDSPAYRIAAEEQAARIVARHALREGRMVVADESMHEVTVDYSTGLSGVVGFALRLRHGGPRLWMPDTATAALDRSAVR
ncbi:class IV lanthionine synthetase LanL [Streptomyces sp. P1-3]|uniref:class IV lanthionine synthetase LanL n=1 Tax=Streptomyces sp. P1-3 TaxID=3421658 RepID=UPI003D36E02F